MSKINKCDLIKEFNYEIRYFDPRNYKYDFKAEKGYINIISKFINEAFFEALLNLDVKQEELDTFFNKYHSSVLEETNVTEKLSKKCETFIEKNTCWLGFTIEEFEDDKPPLVDGKVPEFDTYAPTLELEDSNKEDRSINRFYFYMVQQIEKGNYVDIEGNISYLHRYREFKFDESCHTEEGRAEIRKHFLFITDHYLHDKVTGYFNGDLNSLLLVEHKFKEWVEVNEPATILSYGAHAIDQRLDIINHIGLDFCIKEIIRGSCLRKNDVIQGNEGAFTDIALRLMKEYGEENGGWKRILFEDFGVKKSSFQRTTLPSGYQAPWVAYDWSNALYNNEIIKQIARNAENVLRDILKIPRIGEGWVSETQLFFLVKDRVGTECIQHGSPSFLGRQHYDVWLPRWSVAIEFQGEQHDRPVDFFGGEEAFKKNQERDARKRKLSKENGVVLIEVRKGYDEKELINEIMKVRTV
ncbi:hypothetical protein [Vibrio parahaemolyticus]|nr:hypothetical protein [Vibrio parahaemolyticus]